MAGEVGGKRREKWSDTRIDLAEGVSGFRVSRFAPTPARRERTRLEHRGRTRTSGEMPPTGAEAASMMYSETQEHSGGHVHFSPDGKLLATAAMYRLMLRDVDTLQIVQIFSCMDRIDRIEWSCDSKYVLCGIYARGIAQVWSVEQPDWHCKIDEGPLGLAHVRWAPDGRHVLATSEFRLRITVWSLLDRSVFFLRFPKFAKSALSFSADGEHMALAHRRDGRDYVQVLACDGWSVIKRFDVSTKDLADLRYAPRGHTICVMDSILEPQVLLYRDDGQLLAIHSMAPTPAAGLGPKGFAWSPAADLLVICGFDECASVLHHGTWSRVGQLQHHETLRAASAPDAVAYIQVARTATGRVVTDTSAQESESDAVDGGEVHLRRGHELIYTAQKLPLSLPSVKPMPENLNPHMGVGIAEWSACGRFLATRNDAMPRAVFIWDGSTLGLHSVMLQANPVRGVAWHPTRQALAVCTGISAVFLWSPHGCQTAPLPQDRAFRVTGVAWNAAGDAMVLLDKEFFCVCFVRLGVEPHAPPPADTQLSAHQEALLRRILAEDKNGDGRASKRAVGIPQADENFNALNNQRGA